jgi:hypothetical protein
MYRHAAFVLGCVLAFPAYGFAQSQSPATSIVRPAAWRYASEQEWIVSDIASTIAAEAARGHSTLDAVRVTTLPAKRDVKRFQVDAGTQRIVLEIRDHIWSAANYVPFARKLVKARPSHGHTEGLLDALTAPRVEVLDEVNQDLGHLLAAESPTRSDHEDAALLIGVMALREGPGRFSDVRHLLSLMTAHLAIAQAIRGTPTKSGQVAEIIQLALVKRQRDVLERLAKWEAASPSAAERAWIRALKLRATGDWRLLERPQDATLLERIEYVRALAEQRGPNAALDFLDATHPEDVVDWSRILEKSMTVEVSERVSEDAAVGELREAAYVWASMSGQDAISADTIRDVIARLNTDLSAFDGSIPAVPIDWPTWGASFQRHLAADIVEAVRHESDWERRKGNPRDIAANHERLFGRLPLFPFAKLQYALDDEQRADAMKDVIGLMLRRPEAITSANWLAGVVPHSAWFTTSVPAPAAKAQ